MTSNIEKNVSEIIHLDYAMDTTEGDEFIGVIVADAYRRFPTDFLRALEEAENGRLSICKHVLYSEAGDTEVRDRIAATLNMFCEKKEETVAVDAPSRDLGYDRPAPEPVGYTFSMALTAEEVDVMICMIDSDADNEHDNGHDEGLRAELGADLRESLVEINGAGGTIFMSPGQLYLVSMLTDNWAAFGSESLRTGPDDFTEQQQQALIDETDAILASLKKRLIPAHNPIIVL